MVPVVWPLVLPSSAVKLTAYTRPFRLPERSARTSKPFVFTPFASGAAFGPPAPRVVDVASSLVMPVMVIVTSSPSGSVTPRTLPATNLLFGGQRQLMLG